MSTALNDDTPPVPSEGSSGDKKKVLICLLRLDLRVSDNPLFHFAHTAESSQYSRPEQSLQFNEGKFPDERELSSEATHLVPLYVFDEREIELSGLPNYQRKGPEARTADFGFWKTGSFRAR
jgi:deoxyribodipyrimidine photo-lyase